MYLRCKWCVQSRWVGRYGGLGGSGNARVWAHDAADGVVCGVIVALAINGRSTTLTLTTKQASSAGVACAMTYAISKCSLSAADARRCCSSCAGVHRYRVTV